MDSEQLIDFLRILEKLKCNTRHSWTTSGRQESVAEHSWRLAVMALLLKNDFPELDMGKVVEMCLIHDWGEAVTGDIPAFIKSSADEETEEEAIHCLLKRLPEKEQGELTSLFDEMLECRTGEAKLCKALDKIEALIQHNEAGAKTWLPLEYELNLTYGDEASEAFSRTKQLREVVREETKRIIEGGKKDGL